MREALARTENRAATRAALVGFVVVALAACGDPVRPSPAVENAGSPGLDVVPAADGLTLTIRSLGTLEGRRSRATDINDVAQVVGDAGHAFLWTVEGGMRDLGTLGGAATSRANGINALGQVVGESGTASGRDHAFLWTSQGGMVDLGTLGGSGASVARAINGEGKVVGMSATAAGVSHAFLWTAQGGMTDLGTLGGCCSDAHGINAQGQVVGEAVTASQLSRAFLWTAQAGMMDLGTLGGQFSLARDINDRGQVVGDAQTASGDVHAFLWTVQGGMVDLGTLGGCCSQGYGINELGQVVGQSSTVSGASHAFLWTAQLGMVDIGALIGSTTLAADINDHGQVAGFVEGRFPFVRATLWTILSEPLTTLELRLVDIEGRLLQLIRTAPRNPARQLAMLSANDEVVAALDALRQDDPGRQLAAAQLAAAVGDLDAALAQGLIDATRATTLRNQLAGVVRELAKVAIEEAVARRGDPADIAAARAARDSGDARRAAGDFSGAVQFYRQAIELAEGA